MKKSIKKFVACLVCLMLFGVSFYVVISVLKKYKIAVPAAVLALQTHVMWGNAIIKLLKCCGVPSAIIGFIETWYAMQAVNMM